MPRPRRDVPDFWTLADAMIERGEAEEGTLMGFPCLRVEGRFFAMTMHDRDDLVVKLSMARVKELVHAGVGLPFAPAGKTFREWVAVPHTNVAHWPALIEEAANSARAAS